MKSLAPYILVFIFFLTIALPLHAHVGTHSKTFQWTLENGNAINGNYIDMTDGWVRFYHKGEIQKHHVSDFSLQDQAFFFSRKQNAERINNVVVLKNSVPNPKTSFGFFIQKSYWFFTIALLLLFAMTFTLLKKQDVKYKPSYFLILTMFLYAIACSKNSDATTDTTNDSITQTDNTNVDSDANTNSSADNDTSQTSTIELLESLISNFEGVTGSYDDTYFYVGSNGLPTHGMMEGITAWNLQVPIAQDYVGDNLWAIPLRPEVSDNPLDLSENLMRGAVAIAVNGVPIFNPLNNRGEDAYAIGELDQWGGHAGRADDYHYHIPPTHLSEVVGSDKPVAFAFDGFPIYGETSLELDSFFGVESEDGSFAYYTDLSTAPYFMPKLKGKVTTNGAGPENQIEPQARSQGPRGDSLTGTTANTITKFEQTGTNAYRMEYEYNNETYAIAYSWDEQGNYTYTFIQPDGSSTTETYASNP